MTHAPSIRRQGGMTLLVAMIILVMITLLASPPTA
jgi:Tfp pilus assembly protein PilX